MPSNRILSLNVGAADFAVEELEPHMEMQIVGPSADPDLICPAICCPGC